MLPSDHFVRMYNELFKMLEDRSHEDLQNYWLEVSRLQDTIVGEYIRRDGLQGMFDYWEHIRIEENCDADLTVNDEYFEFKMNVCPSLSKNLDNDAGPCELYCDHCSGWIIPIMNKHPMNTAVNNAAVSLDIFSLRKIAAKMVEKTGPV